jgi:hypothetical protein
MQQLCGASPSLPSQSKNRGAQTEHAFTVDLVANAVVCSVLLQNKMLLPHYYTELKPGYKAAEHVLQVLLEVASI